MYNRNFEIASVVWFYLQGFFFSYRVECLLLDVSLLLGHPLPVEQEVDLHVRVCGRGRRTNIDQNHLSRQGNARRHLWIIYD